MLADGCSFLHWELSIQESFFNECPAINAPEPSAPMNKDLPLVGSAAMKPIIKSPDTRMKTMKPFDFLPVLAAAFRLIPMIRE